MEFQPRMSFRRFRYAADPLCLLGIALYILNRWVLKPHVASAFLHGQFDDFWLIPCALPLVLWCQRRFGWRDHDGPPTVGEVGFHLAVWSVLFEVIGPRIAPVTGDAWDVVAYAGGSLLGLAWWHRDRIGVASVGKGFDRLAPFYRTMEWFLAGGRLQRCRTAALDRVAVPGRLLVAGVGPGRFLEAVLERWPTVSVLCVDASEAMLEQAGQAWCRAGGDPCRLELVQAELPGWRPPAGAFDGLATHFFLDCFGPDEQARVVRDLAVGAAPGAWWLVSEFAVPGAGLSRWRAQAVLWLAYRFFRLVTRLPASRLNDPDPALLTAGFRLERRRTFEWGLLRSDGWIRA